MTHWQTKEDRTFSVLIGFDSYLILVRVYHKHPKLIANDKDNRK